MSIHIWLSSELKRDTFRAKTDQTDLIASDTLVLMTLTGLNITLPRNRQYLILSLRFERHWRLGINIRCRLCWEMCSVLAVARNMVSFSSAQIICNSCTRIINEILVILISFVEDVRIYNNSQGIVWSNKPLQTNNESQRLDTHRNVSTCLWFFSFLIHLLSDPLYFLEVPC